MEITFNEDKDRRTQQERGFSLSDAVHVFKGRTFTRQDTRKDYPEDRYNTVGTWDGRMHNVTWTPTENGRHIISMRKCNDREQQRYGHLLV